VIQACLFDGVMNLENWDALAAVASINKACEALHTGKDGISKTWSEVAVHADVLLNKKNGRQRSVPLVLTNPFHRE
jgi:hypothetical protein